MTLQDTFETQQFGPPNDSKWEVQDDFNSVATPQVPVSFDEIRPQAIAEARAQVEQICLNIRDQVDRNEL